jgi:general secretion pathway protein M
MVAQDGLKLTAIAAGAIAAVFFVLLPVGYLFTAQHDDIKQSKELLAVYRAEIASRDRLEDELAGLRRREAAGGGLVSGTSAALAAADIQSRMKAMIERHGGRVRSVQNLPAAPVKGFEKVSVRYDLSITAGGLKGLLYQIETGTPYLFLDDIDLRMPEGWQEEGPQNAPPEMQVRWTVEGYREGA